MTESIISELKNKVEASKTLPKSSYIFEKEMKEFRKKNKLSQLKRFFKSI